jgi:uncharacterized protein
VSNPAVGMPCPVCKVALTMSERQGVEIDYCPQCRGVWLDRGELDKILERSAAEVPPAPQAPTPPQQPQAQQPYPAAPMQQPWGGDHRGYPQHGGYNKYGHPKRRKSFLEELFD